MPSFRESLTPVATENRKPVFEMTPEEAKAYEATKSKQTGIATHSKTPQKVIQRTPEGVSAAHRFQIANFSNDPKTAVKFLRTEYPDFEVGIVNDQVAMRPKGSPQDFMAVVPHFTMSEIVKNPKEILSQLGDISYDIGSGIATGGAAAAGAAATAPSGPGALLGGAAAAGATGAALEATRQQIGKELGINTEINPGQVASSGVINAAAVPLFGAGRAKGAAGKAYDFMAGKVAPKAGELISGVPADAIRNYAKHAPEIRKMQKEGVLGITEKTHESITKPLRQAKMDVGESLGNAIDNAGATVDITAAKRPWQDLLFKLQKQYDERPTRELLDKINDVKSSTEYYFKPIVKEVEPVVPQSTGILDEYGKPIMKEMLPVEAVQPPSNVVSARSAFELKKSMSNEGNLGAVKEGTRSSLAGKSPAEKEIINAARDSKKILDEHIGVAVGQADEVEGGLGVLNSQYRELTNLEDYLERYFKTPETTFNTMTNIQGKNKKVLKETLANMDKSYGTDALKNAELFDAYKYFGDASFNPLSTKGSTSTGRAVPLAGFGAGAGALASSKLGAGYLPGAIAGGITGAAIGSPAAIAKYANVGRGVRNVQGVLGPMNSAPGQIGSNIYASQHPDMANPWTLFGTPIQKEQK